MNLVIDIGNTRNKFAIIDQNSIMNTIVHDQLSVQTIRDLLIEYPKVNSAIISTVKKVDSTIVSFLREQLNYFIELNEHTNIPIENFYETKSTLGKDRLAAVIGANNIFPDSNVLVIDMGTAITYDFINESNQFIGGTISPGLEMRFKALNHYTDQLPLLKKNENYQTIGKNTSEAIISGVQNGILFEIDGYINTLKSKHNDIKVILTGGDAIFFDKKLKNTIFVNLNLNFIGLNTILEHNKSND